MVIEPRTAFVFTGDDSQLNAMFDWSCMLRVDNNTVGDVCFPDVVGIFDAFSDPGSLIRVGP